MGHLKDLRHLHPVDPIRSALKKGENVDTFGTFVF